MRKTEEERRTAPLNLKIKPTIWALLKAQSEKEGRTRTIIVEKVLTQYFKDYKK